MHAHLPNQSCPPLHARTHARTLFQALHFGVSFYVPSKAQELVSGAGVRGASVGPVTVMGPLDPTTSQVRLLGASQDERGCLAKQAQDRTQHCCAVGLVTPHMWCHAQYTAEYIGLVRSEATAAVPAMRLLPCCTHT